MKKANQELENLSIGLAESGDWLIGDWGIRGQRSEVRGDWVFG
jgi:hypothetical protein